MTVHGVVNAWVDGRGIDPPVHTSASPIFGIFEGSTIFQLSSTFFVTLYRFLVSAAAQDVGVVRRAYFTGSAYTPSGQYPSSRGMDYWDEANPVGNHAWAVFEFTQAEPKFWVLIQEGMPVTVGSDVVGGNAWTDTNAFGLSNGSPGKLLLPWTPGASYVFSVNENTKHSGVGISVGMDLSGSSPWGGTTNDNGNDSKSNPVWSTNAVSWPRSNNVQGVNNSSRQYMFGLYYDLAIFKGIFPAQNAGGPELTLESFFTHGETKYDNHDTVYHMVIDKDQLLVLVDTMNINNFTFFYFGRYTPYISSSTPPYVSLYKNLMFNATTDVLTINTTQVYGSRDVGFDSAASEDRPLANTTLHHGGILDPATGKVAGASVYADTVLQNVIHEAAFSSLRSLPSASFQMHNPIVCLNEYPTRRAPLGEVTFFKFATWIRSGATLASKTLAAFGTPHVNTFKVIVPWFSGSYPGIAVTRSGTIF